jgi:hypothetical protein
MNQNNERSRPRVTIQIPPPNFRPDSANYQPSPFVPMTAGSNMTNPSQAGNLPNPLVQALYAQKASDFMFKQFEGFNRFTKTGLSAGERSAVWIYTKFRKLSRKCMRELW